MTPSGIEPATFRFVAQHLNHCPTAVPTAIEARRITHYVTDFHRYAQGYRLQITEDCYKKQKSLNLFHIHILNVIYDA